AEREQTRRSDRAELWFALGHALYRKGDLGAAATALERARSLSPNDAEFHFLLGLVQFDAGGDRDAAVELRRAVELGLPRQEDERARTILRSLGDSRRSEIDRFYVNVSAAAGYDSNVPQSGLVVSASNKGTLPNGAAFLAADLDVFWRATGDARNGFALDYRLGQVAYLSSALDPYSLQEHDLTLSHAWT